MLGPDGQPLKAGDDDLPPGVEGIKTIDVDMSKIPNTIGHRMLMAQQLTEIGQKLIMMTLQPHKFQDKHGATVEMGSPEHVLACDVEFARLAGAAMFAVQKADEKAVLGRLKMAGAPESIIETTRIMFEAGRMAIMAVQPDLEREQKGPSDPEGPKQN